ncbi:MAG TPA: ABC transporter ATP-binding protein [Solirubrobacteraceae bacterium]|jgi:putative ABC transport system ATP-binding protein|nr:ABC transporter ATP-binding protein [Solirubrobacteraceae bacterium]
MLQLDEVVKHYRVGDGEIVRAVDGVSLSVGAGELVALYGPSGSGKTTLLMLIAGLLVPDSGSVRVNGREVPRLTARERAHYRRSELGFIRQSLDLIPGVRADDNAALKLLASTGRRDAQRRVAPLLERLGLNGRAVQRAEQLSMGERQRVMIARALSTGPSLVLADEPTGSLDTDRGREVLTLLVEVCHERDVGVLLVTHDPRAAAFADHVHALRDGRLVPYKPEDNYLPFEVR